MTDSPSGFTPIATRSLVLKRPDGRETPIYVAIGAPYRPATLKVTGADGAGCLVLTCDDPDLATEVWGQDEMEALAGALNFLGLYLVSLTEKTCGTLHAVDGSTFDPLGSDFFKQGAEFVAKKAAKKL